MDKHNVKAKSFTTTNKIGLAQFDRKKIIGTGSYGIVELVQKKGEVYALKIVEKKKLEKYGLSYQVGIQRQLLSKMCFPGVIKLFSTFQDNENLYFCLEFCEKGNLKNYLSQNQHLLTPSLKIFYIAQIVSILGYLQSINVIHRDLKPQNILITSEGHLKLIDFATANLSNCTLVNHHFKFNLEKHKNKVNEDYSFKNQKSQVPTTLLSIKDHIKEHNNRKGTFVGSSEYVSPEMLERDQSSFSSDLWSLGCIIYQIYYGTVPFTGLSDFQIFQKIISFPLQFPSNKSVPEEAIDLIKRLMEKQPDQRIGCGSKKGLMYKDLLDHPLFRCVGDIRSIYSQKVRPLVNVKSLNGQQLLQYYVQQLSLNPSIVYMDIVQKRTLLMYNEYLLALTNNLQLIRIKIEEPQKYVVRKVLIENNQQPANLLENNVFTLKTDHKIYKLKSTKAQQWVKHINIISKQFMKNEHCETNKLQLETHPFSSQPYSL